MATGAPWSSRSKTLPRRGAGVGISASTVDAKIRQARFDRFLSRVFVDGEASEWISREG